MEQPKATKVDQDEPIRTIEVLENGNIEMDETIHSKVSMSGREFITFIRNHEEKLREIDYQLSEDYKKGLIDNKTKLESQVEKLKEHQKLVEEYLKKEYEKQQKQTSIDQLKNIVKDKEMRKNPQAVQYVSSMWNKYSTEDIDRFSEEEKKVLLDIVSKAKRNK